MKKLLILCFVSISSFVFAQKIKLVEGDLAALNGQNSIDIELTYDGVRVGKFEHEKDYIEKKKADYNAKEPGKGDQWEKDWYNDRQARFEPRFIESFTAAGMTEKQGAAYTLIFNTTFIEPGFNIGISRRNAYIDGVVVLVATNNKSKVLAKITIDNAPGRIFGGYDFDTGLRIQESYATAGKDLGRFIAKSVKK